MSDNYRVYRLISKRLRSNKVTPIYSVNPGNPKEPFLIISLHNLL